MTNSKQDLDRDEVLYAFHQLCERPTIEDISEWVTKYPQFAEDIRTHAAIARDWAACDGNSDEQVDQVTLDRAFSRALNIVYDAKQRQMRDPSNNQSFSQLMAARNITIPVIAQEIGIERSVIADLIGGRIRPPIGKRLTQAVTKTLLVSVEHFADALQMALGSPKMGMAKACRVPTIEPQSYEYVIKNSGMSQEAIRYWLEED